MGCRQGMYLLSIPYTSSENGIFEFTEACEKKFKCHERFTQSLKAHSNKGFAPQLQLLSSTRQTHALQML